MRDLPDAQTHFDHAMLFAFLEDHLSKSPRKKTARLDELFLRKLSDIAACHETLVAVRLHRPQNTSRTAEEVWQSEDRAVWKVSRDKTDTLTQEELQKVLTIIGSGLVQDFSKVKVLSGARNMAWLEQRRALQTVVEKFWQTVRDIVELSFKDSGLHQEEISDLLEVISATSTVEHLSAVAREEEEIKKKVQNDQLPLSGGFKDLVVSGTESGSGWTLPTPREKVKTRPTGTNVLEETPPEPKVPCEDPAPLKLIYVTKRALTVINLMFPYSQEEAGRSVTWDEFVHAMSDAGFTATNNGGSVVRFEGSATGKEGGGAIVFHKPHPIPKVDGIMLRNIGRRMAKWFDWSRERFVLGDGAT